jgi:hypothetical protein
VPDALFVETGVHIVEATPVFESSAATAVVVTEEARGQAFEASSIVDVEKREGIHGSSSNSSAKTSNCRTVESAGRDYEVKFAVLLTSVPTTISQLAMHFIISCFSSGMCRS